ncbi:adenylosuccinate synthetase [Candidatus Microgenomates bacterium]|nr:MAG: adenylosuccinate synthetase [Candidatus Microgenomates bacterium]
MPKNKQNFLTEIQEELFLNPQKGIENDLKNIYEKDQIILGWPKDTLKIFHPIARKNTSAIIGISLGDEGKGRFVDSKIEEMLKNSGIKKVFVIRYQGGNNAGHTLEKDHFRLALHLVPSGVLHKEAIGIMDQGMVVHVEDLETEVSYVEEKVGSLKGRLFLSEDAILATDLERAEEVLNGIKTGAAKGGTGRGISPAYAHHYDRVGLKIYDLLDDNWQEILEKKYIMYQKEFAAFDLDLSYINVPDFNLTSKTGRAQIRKVGHKKEFMDRLQKTRSWLIKRNFITNTFLVHRKIYKDKGVGIIFEGCQAEGLDAWLGTRPDVTSSNTSIYGARDGTAFWLPKLIDERIGIIKVPYSSSVGSRRMPTHIDLPDDLQDLGEETTADQKWAAFVRKTACEYGTTTGRPRDINFFDLAFISYNARMSGVEMITATHLDISQENQTIKVCTHYEDQKGNFVPYQPGLRHQKNITPIYVELAGWNGEACRKAKKAQDLPCNALKFLSFIQARTGFPIVSATTGPKRENIISF